MALKACVHLHLRLGCFRGGTKQGIQQLIRRAPGGVCKIVKEMSGV